MKKLGYVAILVLAGTACRSPRPVIELGGYFFDCKGQTYRIESVTPSDIQGYNFLIRKEEEQLVLRGVDKEQDGILDELTIGSLTLAEAREIYKFGLEEGERLGYIKMRTFAREFRTEISHNNCILATYVLALGEVYNKLTISNIIRNQAVVVDKEADGVVDSVETGDRDLVYYQKIYQAVIEQGIRQKKIEKVERFIIVAQ
jgi:hypothetical protein